MILCKQRILFATNTNTSKNLFVNIQKKIQKKQIFKQKNRLHLTHSKAMSEFYAKSYKYRDKTRKGQ